MEKRGNKKKERKTKYRVIEPEEAVRQVGYDDRYIIGKDET